MSDEVRETLMWAGLADNYHTIKTKEVDKKGKTLYRLKMNRGEILVYSSKVIYVNGHKCSSVTDFRRHLTRKYIESE